METYIENFVDMILRYNVTFQVSHWAYHRYHVGDAFSDDILDVIPYNIKFGDKTNVCINGYNATYVIHALPTTREKFISHLIGKQNEKFL